MNPCKYQQLVSVYFDNELTTEERRHIEEHLTTCKECQEFLNEISFYRTTLQSTKIEINDNRILHSVLSKVEESQNSIYAWQNVEAYIRRVLLVFAIVVIFIFSFLYDKEQQRDYNQKFTLLSDSSVSIFTVTPEEITKQDIAYVAFTSR